jgi:hypothetical protein
MSFAAAVVEADEKRRAVEVPSTRPRHPLAQSDVNRTYVLANQLPAKSAPVTRPPPQQQLQKTSMPIRSTVLRWQRRLDGLDTLDVPAYAQQVGLLVVDVLGRSVPSCLSI